MALGGRGDRRGELADHDERVHALRDVDADGLVRADREGAELEHVAKHRDTATAHATVTIDASGAATLT